MQAGLLNAIRDRSTAERATGRQFAATRTSRKTAHFNPPAETAVGSFWADLDLSMPDAATREMVLRHGTITISGEAAASDEQSVGSQAHALLKPEKAFMVMMNIKFSDASILAWLERTLSLGFTERTAIPAASILKAWPTDEEWEPIQAYRGPFVGLNEADTLFYVLRNVPRAKTKLSIAVYATLFDERVQDLSSCIDVVVEAINQICACAQLPEVLGCLYSTFHYLNHRRLPPPRAPGFRLCWLSKVDETKSYIDKTSFLDLFIEDIKRTRPHLLTFTSAHDKLHNLAQIAHKKVAGDFQVLELGLAAIIQELADSASEGSTPTSEQNAANGGALLADQDGELTMKDFGDAVTARARLGPFLTVSRQRVMALRDTVVPRLQDLRGQMATFTNAVRTLNIKFGEDPTAEYDQTVSPLNEFVQKFKARVEFIQPKQQEPPRLETSAPVASASGGDNSRLRSLILHFLDSDSDEDE